MAKNQHSQNSSGECQEVYIAITWPAQSLMSSGPAPAPPQTIPVSATTRASQAFRLKAAARQLSSSAEVIPIEIDPRLSPAVLQNFNRKTATHSDSFQKGTGGLTKVSSKIKQETAPTYVPVEQQMKMRTPENVNDKFTAYINRVKHEMLRSLSNVESAAEISPGHKEIDNKVTSN